MSRIFNKVLIDMIDYTLENEDYTLIENLVMFNIVKGIITDSSYSVDVSNIKQYEDLLAPDIKFQTTNVYDETLVKYLYEAENKYVEFLKLHYGVTEAEIRFLEDNEVENILEVIKMPYKEDDISLFISLTERFPLLKYIVFSNKYSVDYYDKFLDENKNILIKE